MSKTNAWLAKALICGALASMMVLAFHVGSWAQQCTQPNINTVLCANPTPPGVDYCGVVTNQTACGNSHAYTIKNFPNKAMNSTSGATKEVQANCYYDDVCAWNPKDNACEVGTGLPTAGAWYLAAQTVNNPNVTCPAGD